MDPAVGADDFGELVVKLPLYRLALLARPEASQAGACFLATS